MDKKIIIGAVVVIIIAAVAGYFLFFSGEEAPDFEVNGNETEVVDNFNIAADAAQTIALNGENFTIPSGFNGTLSYQAGFPKADFSNEDKYFTIISYGKGNVTDKVNDFMNLNSGFSLGATTVQGNITYTEINQGADVVSHMYFLQIGENVYEINLYGIDIKDLI